MKKLFFIMSVALAATFAFSSCNSDDEDEAMVLSGEWQGDMGMWYEDEYGDQWDADETYIRLVPDHTYATYGIGYQEDYYRHGPYKYLWYKFYWKVIDGVIYFTYPYDPNLDTEIYDYRLTNDYFKGYYGDSRNRFSLYKISDFYYWTPTVYVESDYYAYQMYTSYSNEYQGAAKSKDFKKAPKIVKRGRHFNDKK